MNHIMGLGEGEEVTRSFMLIHMGKQLEMAS
jgi:hypothetical protein